MVIWFPLIAFLIVGARLATRYWIQRENTDTSTPYHDDQSRDDDGTPTVNTPEARAEMMRQQVIAKIHWGARDGEVFEWLQERHGITGHEADELLAMAHRAKRKAVRMKAVVMLVFSGCGILLAGGFIGLQLWSHVFRLGMPTAWALVIAFVSVPAFLRNLWLLFSGKMDGSVD